MRLKCHQCNRTTKPILKMGGLICANCRVILKYPSDPEWREVFEAQKPKEKPCPPKSKSS